MNDKDWQNAQIEFQKQAAEAAAARDVENALEHEYRNNTKLRVRTLEDYERLWNRFVQDYKDDYESYIGTKVEDIERIGVQKFIDVNDWYFDEEIPQYRTDIHKIIVCRECGDEFAVFPRDYGLCQECMKKFNIEALEGYLASLNDEIRQMDFITLFAFDKQIKDMFLFPEDQQSDDKKDE